MQTLTVVSLFAASLSVSHGTPLNIYNQCSESIQLYDNSVSETIAAGSSTTRILALGFNGMFRNGIGSQATLAEFSITGGYIWYDISIIPTGSIGPGNCLSLEACKAITGGTGFNTAMQISPSGCDTVTCMNDGCADAYQFPSDGSKTHSCSDTATIDLVFCPGGSRAAATTSSDATTSSSATVRIAASTPTTVAPTLAPIPTRAPTRAPTIAPTQAPQTTATSPVPSTETPVPTYTSQPTTSLSVFSTAGSCKDSRSLSVSVENTTVPVTPETIPTPASSARRTSGTDNDRIVSTQSTNSGTAAGTYVVGVVGSLVVVAAIAVAVAVRRKKEQLEALEPKDSVSSYSYVGALAPRGNINVMHA
ncbi:hypothetical protein DVH05_009439 [Phytophthora capsici]|nr:hypothetical protein DVH05_009439 [Phytophthora capsici]|eukprot:jgi/Phyca11/115421/e_gw1.28.220.1